MNIFNHRDYILIRRVREDCPRLLINRELVGQNDLLRSLGLACGLDFDPEHGTRDVFWEGMCDDGCQLLADKLGWGVSIFHLCIILLSINFFS